MKNKNRATKRLLQIESLEQREMLTVAPLLYSIYSEQSQYSTDFNTEAIAAPTASDQTASSIKLTWNAATLTGLRPEEPFKVERSAIDSAGNEKWTQIGTDIPYSYTIGNGTYSCELKGLTASTEYKLRISFSSTVLGRGYTEAVTVSTLSSEIKAEAVSSTSIKLSWNIAGKTGTLFTVKKRLAGTTAWEDTGITVKADGSATVTKTCTVDYLDPAKKYEFQIVYYDTNSFSRSSQVTECSTLYVLTASNNTLNSVNLSWNAAMGGTSHEVQIYTGTAKPTATATWTKAAAENVGSNEYKVTGLKENASYYFRVRYIVTENGEAVTKYTDILSYSSPTSIKLTNVTENSIEVSWTFGVQSGTSCYIQTSATGAEGTWSDYPGANTVNKSYTLKNLDSGKEYYIRVRYYSPAAVESFSAAERIATGIATKLDSVTENSAAISWNIPGLSTPVNIQRCDGSLDPVIDTNWRTIATNISGTSYINNNIGSSNKYYYRVSYESGGETKYTIYVTALTIGTVTVSEPSLDTVKLDWNFKPKQGANLIVQQYRGNSVPTSDSAWGTASVTLDTDNQGCTVKNLTPGLNYFFRVRYTSELGTEVQTTNATKIVMTVGTNLIASETNAESVTLRWAKTGFTQQKDKNFTIYKRDLSGANGTNSNWYEIATINSDQNTYTVTNLWGDTQYQFKIGYQGESESQAVSSVLDLTTKPYTVDILNLSQDSAQLQWTFSTDKDLASNTSATGDGNGVYIVQKYLGNGEPSETERLLAVNDTNWTNVGTSPHNMTPTPRYNLTGLTKNTTYYYRIVYTYRTGDITDGPGSTYVVPLETKFSEIVTVKTKSDLWTTSTGAHSVNLAWEAKSLNSGTQYSVQYRIKAAGIWTTASSTVSATSYMCDNLLADTAYEFRILYNGSSETATIETKTSKSILSAVSKELGIGTASVTIEMKTVTGESVFVLYYRPKGEESDPWSQNTSPGTSSGTVSFQLTLIPETEYEFKIVYNSNSVSHESEIKFVSLSDDLMPSNVSGSSITIRWDDSSFSDKRSGSSYILQYRVTGSGAVWSTAPAPSNNSSTVNNLSANTEYEFRVQYTTDGGATAYSTIKTARTKQPVISVSAPQVGKVKLAWTFESVDGYKIQYKDDAGTWVDAATISTNSLRETTIDNLKAKTDYIFRIAYKTAQSGTDYVYSDEAEITTLGGFSVVENSTGSQSITVKWDYVTDSTYRLQYKTKGAQIWIETIPDIPSSTKEYMFTALEPGNDYTIQLTYFDGTEKHDELNTATTKTAPETPTGLSVSEITNSGAKITWMDNSIYEDDYIIETTNNVTGNVVKTSIGLGLGADVMTYTLTNLDTKISYTVKVYAKNTEGSSTVIQTTFTTLDVKRPAAVTTVKAAATPKSITLSWKIKSVTDIPDPNKFRIEYYDDKDKNREKLWYEVQGLSSAVVYDSATQTYSCTISNSFVIGDSLTVTLENKTAYQFRIIALAPNSTFGDAAATSIKATTAALVVPSSLSTKNITLTTATVSFKDTDKNVGSSEKVYTLYYAAGTKKYSKWEDVPAAEIQSVTVPSDKLSYDLTGLKAETVYTYIIESDYLGQKTATKTSSFTTSKLPAATTIKGGYTLVSNKYSFLLSWKVPASKVLSANITIQYALEVSASGKKDTFIRLSSSAVGTSSSGLKYATFSFSDVIKLLANNNYDVSTKVSALSFRVAGTFVENNTTVGTSYSSVGRVTLPKFV
ncbi:MAG: fibronectin type III domain-containing protein [Planctomycetaceae bacterium]|nr:fibronectin type III domain-containing protein [Planctomycetaceae bacterium]